MHIAYFAGLFDGDGHVGVKHQKAWDFFSLCVTMTNNHKGVLELYQEKFGGSILPPRHYGLRKGKGTWTWQAYSSTAIKFLEAVQDHIIIKKEQVALALNFPLGDCGKRVDEDVYAKRKEIYDELIALKQQVWTEPEESDWNHGNIEELEVRADVQEAIQLYQTGLTQEEVAEQLGLPYSTVGYWVRQLGESRSRSEAAKIGAQKRKDAIHKRPEVKMAIELYEQGMSSAEVARKLGQKPATVNYWLRRMGKTRSLKQAQRVRRARERET